MEQFYGINLRRKGIFSCYNVRCFVISTRNLGVSRKLARMRETVFYFGSNYSSENNRLRALKKLSSAGVACGYITNSAWQVNLSWRTRARTFSGDQYTGLLPVRTVSTGYGRQYPGAPDIAGHTVNLTGPDRDSLRFEDNEQPWSTGSSSRTHLRFIIVFRIIRQPRKLRPDRPWWLPSTFRRRLSRSSIKDQFKS